MRVALCMRSIFFTLFVFSFCFLSGCQKDPKSITIPPTNKASFLEGIGDVKGLTIHEVRLLDFYSLMHKAKDAEGRTIGEVLEDAKKEHAEFLENFNKNKEDIQESMKALKKIAEE